MQWRTHVAGGIASLWLLEFVLPSLPLEVLAPMIGAVAFGALVPDLDATRSKIASLGIGGIQPFSPVSTFVNRTLGHRGFLHSPAGFGLFGLLTLPLVSVVGGLVWSALCLGYASHLALDACTRSGIPLWPLRRRGHLLPKPLRLVTGSLAEEVCLSLLGMVDMLFLLRHLARSN